MQHQPAAMDWGFDEESISTGICFTIKSAVHSTI